MPSGITHGIYDGTEMDVDKYIERVARSMTDFIHMREKPYDSRLTKRNLATPKYMNEAKVKFDQFMSKSDEELYNMWETETNDMRFKFSKAIEDNSAMVARYEQMITQVQNTEFPEGLEYGKEYALKYLRESMDFDCHEPDEKWYPTYDFDEWKSKTIAKLAKNVDYYTQEYYEDVARDAEFNEKIDLWSKVVGYDIV